MKIQKKKINEKSNVAANSFHGTMHLIRENLIRKIYKGKLSIFRPTLIFGSKDPHNGYGPNQFIRLALKKKKLVLFGKGEEKRDHIHIETVIKILSHAFFKKKIGTYNIASGKIFSFFLIAKKIEKVILRKKIIIFKKRNGPLHHLGLRQFNVTKIKKNFKDIKLINIFDFLDYFDLKEYKK